MKQYLTDIAFYHDTEVPRWIIEQMGNLSTGTQFLFNTEREFWRGPETLDDFINADDHHAKIACFHVPFPEETTWMDRVRKVHPYCDHVIIFCSELHDPTVDQLYQLDLPRITMYLSGFLNVPMKNAEVGVWMDWFMNTTYFYRNEQPDLLKTKLTPNAPKDRYFDILLGSTRDHRSFVNNWIKEQGFEDKNIMTYFSRIDQSLKDGNRFILEDDGVEFIPDREISHSIDPVRYYGFEICLSQIAPISVYNKTYYSLVTETNFSNRFNFYTEKIVKPIMCGRLFIAICGKDYLRNLKKFGFETFNSVIDESYDDEPNQQARWTMAMEQLRYLHGVDPAYVLRAVEEITQHNQDLMLNTDWTDQFVSEIRDLIVSFLPAHKD